MYKNIGRKIKGFAKSICAIGIIASVIWGIFFIINVALSTEVLNGNVAIGIVISIISAVLIITFGSLISWLGSLCLYGFGELIEKTAEIAENTKNQLPQE